ncbi:filamentous hemagglutinin family outer membrane protein [Geobacter metallireducens RCH3]|uniref:Filamentous hemagglutinin-like outer membrane protein n=1 Tax=Geobacter metallireducens (strain ATCC 53774 / DSM 7210 / GS-15) TaxID=269799 RepID=Q39VN2_GEOMG|nr:filamentous haemagglutinin family protein [Geobacter metallireducens]ABB31692.1 filamentous hemagglutinin-like outer membrane protein [Geobacter metallireducens GS-15]EHP89433.1 filamentous hemagglutinin family outer membrane protein [Geobacter metallireducens RCH3]
MSRKHSIETRSIALFMATTTALSPVLASAQGVPRAASQTTGVPRAAAVQSSGIPRVLSNLIPPTATTLPQLKPGGVLANAAVDTTGNLLTVNQSADKAVIDWNSFNVGRDATVRFNQNKEWSALNRIWDANPSQIFGTVKADGKIYLINRNGILFGKDARVNVNSIVASSLHITRENFDKSLLKFSNQQGTPDAPDVAMQTYTAGAVANDGQITTEKQGAAILMGSQAENRGEVVSPEGQIGLAAGDEVELAPDESGKRRYLVKVTANPGVAVNRAEGTMTADSGVIGMYGRQVVQDGTARAVSAIKKNGVIELLATDSISLGKGSRTESPVSASSETAHESFEFKGGDIQLKGLMPVVDTAPDGPRVPVKRIDIEGTVSAPSGSVVLEADERVYLSNGARVDVSGTEVNLAADANRIEFTYTSEILKDEFTQKSGFLKGKTVSIDAHQGASIGDVSGELGKREKTALERGVTGGDIAISARSGDVIVRNGAELNFSGGKTNYAEGSYTTTRLTSQGKEYDIATAPRELVYDGQITKESFHAAHSEGADAGSLVMVAPRMAMDGSMKGSVTRGVFQTLQAEPVNGTGKQSAKGRKLPLAGTAEFGQKSTNQPPDAEDAVLGDTVIAANVALLPADFTDDSDLAAQRSATYLPAATINDSGIGTLRVSSNTTIKTDQGAVVQLQPGGELSLTARSIVHQGNIDVAGGTVNLVTQNNVTNYETLGGEANPKAAAVADEGITIASGSVISTAGDVLDNGPAVRVKTQGMEAVRTNGGTVKIFDRTAKGHGVDVATGSSVDVSGGHVIDTKGKVTGGDAGSVSIQGERVNLDGDIAGYSLVGKKGGGISVHAGEVVVAANPSAISNDGTKTVIADDRFAGSGFSSIEYKAERNLTVAEGANLAPSAVKEFTSTRGGSRVARSSVSDDLVGPSKVKLAAGANLDRNDPTAVPSVDDAKVVIAQNATIKTPYSGEISVSGPEVDVAGTLSAAAGKITLTAKSRSVILRPTARILAPAYLKADLKPLMPNLPLGHTAYDAGTVRVEGVSLNLMPGAIIDVSGSAPATSYARTGRGAVIARTVAGAPGEVQLVYSDPLQPENLVGADFRSAAFLPGLRGGSFSLLSQSIEQGLSLRGDELARLAAAGFDSFSFTSKKSLTFSDDVNLTAGRKILLDAPEMIGTDGRSVALRAPWLVLRNTLAGDDPSVRQAATGSGILTLSGDWLDVDGAVTLSRFDAVSADIRNDIRLFDRTYSLDGTNWKWHGSLVVPGNLSLKADRIYPAMHYLDPAYPSRGMVPSDFAVKAGRDITILPATVRSTLPVPSAGGALLFQAGGNIIQQGTLAAPAGTIRLEANPDTGRVYLGAGSVTTVKGEGMVPFGEVHELYWELVDKNNPKLLGNKITAAPDKEISATGNEVIVRDGAALDLSGGGTLYGYLFQPGLEGSSDPLGKAGRYVILPDNSVSLPGDRVYLEGSDLLAAGYYTLLPVQYAFLPGALVVTDTGKAMNPGERTKSWDNHTIVVGSVSRDATSLGTTKLTGFEVRQAADVLREGNFTVASLEAGDAGSLSLKGNSTVVDGNVSARPLAGYQGGTLELSGRNVNVQSTRVPLPAGFGAGNPLEALPDNLRDRLFVTADFLNGGFSRVTLGDTTKADTVTVESGSSIAAGGITLAAKNSVILGEDVNLSATKSAGDGVVAIVTPTGDAVLGAGSTVKGEAGVTLDARTLELQETDAKKQAGIDARGGTLTLASDTIRFTEGDAVPAEKGFHVTEKLWSAFGTADSGAGKAPEEIVIKGRSAVAFTGSRTLNAAGDMVIDTPRITASGGEGSAPTITASARNLTLRNTGSQSTDASLADTASLTMAADTITVDGARYDAAAKKVTGGDLRFDGMASVKFESKGDVTFRGKGSLATDGDLTLSAGRVATAYQRDGMTPYIPADFAVKGGGAVTVAKGERSVESPASPPPGGSLAIEGRSVSQSGTIDVAGGRLAITATGAGDTDGIRLENGAKILARGTADVAGGMVALKADAKDVRIESGALVDVSAGAQGDAGSVSLTAEKGQVVLDGIVKGAARGTGRGGSLAMDGSVADFGTVVDTATTGGFTEAVGARIRTGDVTVASGKTLTARSVQVSADSGDVTVNGTVDASHATGGGRVELFAGRNVTVASGGSVTAKGTGTGASGGDVTLGSAARSTTEIAAGTVPGKVIVASGATVDVSGNGGQGGTVLLRGQYDAAKRDVNIDVGGQVRGAREIVAAGVAVKEYTGDKQVMATDTTSWKTEADRVMANAAAIRTRLAGAMDNDAKSVFQYRPDVEVRSTGTMTMKNDLDLTTWRYNGQPGYLTLKAEKDLVLEKKIVDHPTASLRSLVSSTAAPSWGVRMAAGSDRAGANPLAVKRGTGDLKFTTDGSLVYSESGAVDFASGRDTVIAKGVKSIPSYMTNFNLKYNLAAYTGNIRGNVGRNLSLEGGTAIQSAAGNIGIDIAESLVNKGAIRTTGEYQGAILADGTQPGFFDYWNFGEGGNIAIRAGKTVEGTIAKDKSWDNSYQNTDLVTRDLIPRFWAANYTGSATTPQTEGIAAMGGGDVTVAAGGGMTGQMGTFGKGNLTLTSGGDLKGRFLVKEGTGSLTAAGNFGAPPANAAKLTDNPPETVLELFDGRFNVKAQGDVELGTVNNPTVSNKAFSKWNLSYGENAAVSLGSSTGNVSYYGTGAYTNYGNDSNRRNLEKILPGTVEMNAAGDIRLDSDMYLAPSRTGNLVMNAGGSVDGSPVDPRSGVKAKALMSDQSPDDYYGPSTVNTIDRVKTLSNAALHAAVPVHGNDSTKIQVAADGDIRNLDFILPKSAMLAAGRDISNVSFKGQNLRGRETDGNTGVVTYSGDVTEISAGRDIVMQERRSMNGADIKTGTGFDVAGPGAFVVRAGHDIDLGNSRGIQANGNAENPALPNKGADILVTAGLTANIPPGDEDNYFTLLKYAALLAQTKLTERSGILQEAEKAFLVDPYMNKDEIVSDPPKYAVGKKYYDLLWQLRDAGQQEIVAAVREKVIVPFTGNRSTGGGGNVDMAFSEISTSAGGNVSAFAGGDLNVGRTAKSNNSDNTGIYTSNGGNANIFAVGDVNVNESRLMTFRGGDITVWSDEGDINAGRGSRTAISAKPPRISPIKDADGTITGYQLVFTPPALGSGMRTVTYGDDAPPPGGIYAMAPNGVFDAGEAGVSGGRVAVLANAVLNAGNIKSLTGAMTGVPVSASAVSLGGLSGSSSLTESTKQAEKAVGGADKEKSSQSLIKKDETFVTSWLDVKVIGFDSEDGNEKDKKKQEM